MLASPTPWLTEFAPIFHPIQALVASDRLVHKFFAMNERCDEDILVESKALKISALPFGLSQNGSGDFCQKLDKLF